jgi:hypothetical protein
MTFNQSAPPPVSKHRSLQDFKNFATTITDPRERDIAEFAFFAGMQAGSARRHIVALVHGINTDAEWQERLAIQIRTECGLDAYPIGYGNYRPGHFLNPYWDSRKGPIALVTTQLRTLKAQHPDADISVIAHSFGTYIISKILSECADLEIHRLQLCGSVVNEHFRWELVKSRVKQVVNDVGTRDIWPILAKQSTWFYGDSGAFGFKNVTLRDRHFDYAHSDFMSESHFNQYWKPLLVDGQVVDSTWTEKRKPAGKGIAILRRLPIKYFLWAFLIPGLFIGAIGALYFGVSKL